MFLHYTPTSHKHIEVPAEEKWNSEEIRDFVRKLGFVDKDKAESRDKIRCFLRLHQASSLAYCLITNMLRQGDAIFA